MNAEGVVVGVGSDYGPDRIGLEIVAGLQNEPRLRQRAVRLYCCRAPAVELPVLLRGVPWALLVDAIRSDGRPGMNRYLHADDLADDASTASTHGVGVSTTLALLDLLGELPPIVRIVGIEVGGSGSAPPRAWVKTGVAAVYEEVARLCSEQCPR